MKGLKITTYRRAPWGPLRLEADDDGISAAVPGSGIVELRTPSCHASADPVTLAALGTGLPVAVDGVETFTLRQPRRRAGHRRARVIYVAGQPDIVADGCFLRARWTYGMGLETPDRRLVRPRFDVLNGPFLWGIGLTYPAVDASIHPDLLALCGAAEWHLIAAVHR